MCKMCLKELFISLSGSVSVTSWCISEVPLKGSVLPETAAAHSSDITLESASLVSTQIFAIFALDGHLSMLQKL